MGREIHKLTALAVGKTTKPGRYADGGNLYTGRAEMVWRRANTTEEVAAVVQSNTREAIRLAFQVSRPGDNEEWSWLDGTGGFAISSARMNGELL